MPSDDLPTAWYHRLEAAQFRCSSEPICLVTYPARDSERRRQLDPYIPLRGEHQEEDTLP